MNKLLMKKDLKSIMNAKDTFEILIKNFLILNMQQMQNLKLISQMIYWLLKRCIQEDIILRKKWIPAINRFRTVIDDYETTIYTEEALHRLVEVHYTLGLKNEAQKYAKLLGYNYQSSEWYEKSYSIFDQMYAKNKKENLKKIRKVINSLKNSNLCQNEMDKKNQENIQ